jgi:hypothetical protein
MECKSRRKSSLGELDCPQEVNPMILHGRVQNGVVVLQNGAMLPDGTSVEVTPLPGRAGDPLAVIVAMEAEPHLSAEDIAELRRAIATRKRLTGEKGRE